jgi:hypothetical protein
MLSGSVVKPYVTSKRKYVHVAEAIKALAITSTSTQFGPRVANLDDAPEPSES